MSLTIMSTRSQSELGFERVSESADERSGEWQSMSEAEVNQDSSLAIIIVNWNVRDMLAACLRSIQADLNASQLAGQIWVVDNASTDGSVAMLRRDFPQIQLIASDKNLGFAGGNNAALRAIGFDPSPTPSPHGGRELLPEAVLLLNPDTEVQPGALAALYNFLKNNPRVGIAGARLVYRDGSFQHSVFAFPGLWQLAIDLLPLPGPAS